MTLTDDDLPGAWRSADDESRRGQQQTLWFTGGKVGGGLLAAIGGAFSWQTGRIDISAWVILSGFILALTFEILSWVSHCERSWYQGRAVAESVKTLAWRYAVCADPFPSSMASAEAEERLRERISAVTREVSEHILFDIDNPTTTIQMNFLRDCSFATRRNAYISGRTREQKSWYAAKAHFNRRRTYIWRGILAFFEAIAIGLAFSRLAGGWAVDFAGLLASFIAAGTAWVAVKQFSPLASAYSVATNELALQEDKLKAVSEEDWPLVAADAEEAISREHTTWLASRIGTFPNFPSSTKMQP